MKFDLPKENSNIIKVLGVGGGGSNAVNHMFQQGINGVDFLVCNTDQQALDVSPVPIKVQLGSTLTEGRGAGSIAEVGKNAAIENLDELKDIMSKNTKMVFITAGMGGGTGTGAAPVIARAAREIGVLTVGIVTMPFFFEGKKRRQQAEQGIQDIRESVDTLLIINNEKLREMCGNLPIAQAFAMADNVLATAAKGIAEIITRTGYINVDFEDVRTVMSDSGVAIMGSASAEGEDRATKAVEKALASPLLNDNNIEGARYVLLNIAFGNQEVLMDEISDITDYIQEEAGSSADVIWGYGLDETLGDALSVTIIATGFNQNPNTGVNLERTQVKRRINLEEEKTDEFKAPQKVDEPMDEPYLANSSEQTEEVKPSEPVQEQPTFEFEITRHNLNDELEDEAESTSEESEFTLKSNESEETEMHAEEFEAKELEQATDEEFTPDEANEVEESPQPVMKFSLEDSPRDAESNSNEESSSAEKDWEPFIRSDQDENQRPQSANKVEPTQKAPQPEPKETESDREEQAKRAGDRLSRLRDLSMKLRTPSGMSDLENEPAFKRKQINLDDVPSSAENNASRFTLGEEKGEDGESKTRLRPNNPFLHDNVD